MQWPIVTRSTGSNNNTYYTTQDHLGSSSAITNGSGGQILNESFASYGGRRGSNWTGSPSSTDWTNIAVSTRAGFTGHTMLDNLGLVHMNGRVYDSSIGRFMSTDPFAGRLSSSQTNNPYSYVNNNPLGFTDPSGFFSLASFLNPFSKDNPLNPFGTLGRQIAAFPFTSSFAALKFGKKQNDSLLRDNTWLQPIAEIAACYWGPFSCAGASAYLTRLNGGTIRQAFIAGVVTYASSVAYGEVNTGNWATDALAIGAIGGTASSVTGGTFWRGFEFAAGGSLIESGYKYYVQHAPDWGPGQSYPTPNVSCSDPASNCYNFTADGHIPEEDYSKNTFGFNRMLTGGSGDCWVQSGACSAFFDHVPGLQAVSQLHDVWMNSLSSGFNFISMPFAAGLSYGALVGGSYHLVPLLNVGHH